MLKTREEGFGYSFLDQKPVNILKDEVNAPDSFVTMRLKPADKWGPSHDEYAEEEDWDWDGNAFTLVMKGFCPMF